MVAGSLVVSRHSGNGANSSSSAYTGEWTRYCSTNVKGYRIVTGKSLEKLQKEVLLGLQSNEAWRPFGGVTYDPNNKQYLQVMVHPTNQPPTYP